MDNSVPDWFSGRNILVTGATGFMGKVLVEKLLRSCPKISTVYILVRPKRGKDPSERLQEFIDSPIFDKIRDSKNSQKSFEKIQCISGDIMQKDLNLSNSDLHLLKNSVNIVFHMAANVRFDQPLKSALMMNTGGTLNVLETAEQFLKLQVFVHVSTAYCHCDETELFEKPYNAPHSPRKLLELASWMDEDLLKTLTPGLIKSAPNTYAYTKCLTEQLVVEFAAKMPIAIARPSIVTAVWKDPVPGWVENLNGPTGILVGGGKGVIRSMHCKADYTADIMPVDIAINHIILIAYQLGNTVQPTNEPMVVNVCAKEDNPVTWGESLEVGKKHFYDNPFTICLWYPNGSIKSSYIIHMISVLFFHIIPAYVVDFLLVLFRQKPFLVRTQKRIQGGLEVLQYYTTRKWVFHNDKIKQIAKSLSEEDRNTFYTNISNINWDKYILNYVLGARKYCMHEEPHTIPRARKILRRLYILDCIKNFILYGLILWCFWRFSQMVFQSFDNYFEITKDVATIRV